MPKRKYSFNSKLKSEFPFITGSGKTIECTLYKSEFDTVHDGQSDEISHIKT